MQEPELFRIVDTKEYVQILKELTYENNCVSIQVVGNSMSPFLISYRDYVVFQKPQRALKKGDVVFFQRKNGEYVLHRIFKIVDDDQYYIVGDAQTNIEGPIKREQIFGLVIKAKRKGIWIDKKDRWWWFFQHVWIRIVPFRPIVRKIYGVVSAH